MQIEDIRIFMPSADFTASSEFYADLGFLGERVNENLTIFENGDCTFFLQNYFNKAYAENTMLQVCVSNIEAAYMKANAARHKQKISEITNEHWGRVFYVWGPAGELLHITELTK